MRITGSLESDHLNKINTKHIDQWDRMYREYLATIWYYILIANNTIRQFRCRRFKPIISITRIYIAVEWVYRNQTWPGIHAIHKRRMKKINIIFPNPETVKRWRHMRERTVGKCRRTIRTNTSTTIFNYPITRNRCLKDNCDSNIFFFNFFHRELM